MKKINNEDIILYVLNYFENIYGKTFVQKFFFLLEKEIFPNMNLNYIPYHYGPFSRTLDNMVKSLKIKRLITEDVSVTNGDNLCRIFRLTSDGVKKINDLSLTKEEKEKIQRFASKFKNCSPSRILKYVYQKYPNMTINSVLLKDSQ